MDTLLAQESTSGNDTIYGFSREEFNGSGVQQIALAGGAVLDMAAIQSSAWFDAAAGGATWDGSGANDILLAGAGDVTAAGHYGDDTYLYRFDHSGNVRIEEHWYS